MTFREQAEHTAQAVAKLLQAESTPEQSKEAAELIERAIIESYRDAAERCATVALKCCSEDLDMAHKVADEIRRANTALIANLSALR